MNTSWISLDEKFPTEEDGDERGYVIVYLRKDRQWGWPTRVGFGMWNRVRRTSHTHWQKCPPVPLENKDK